MSEENKDIVDVTEISTDFTFQEETELQKFVEKDMPGLTSVTDDKLTQLFSMYMKGKSYTEISQHLKVKKPVILCLSKQNGWYDKKVEYYNAIQANIQDRLLQTKIESTKFLADIVGYYHSTMGAKVEQALADGKKISELMDSKEFAVYFRALEALEKGSGKSVDPGGKGPTINIHGGAKTTVSEDGKTLEIDTSSGEVGDILKSLAELTKARKKD